MMTSCWPWRSLRASKIPNTEDAESPEVSLTTAGSTGYIDGQSERVESKRIFCLCARTRLMNPWSLVDDVPKSETVSGSPIIPLLKNPKPLVSKQYLALVVRLASDECFGD